MGVIIVHQTGEGSGFHQHILVMAPFIGTSGVSLHLEWVKCGRPFSVLTGKFQLRYLACTAILACEIRHRPYLCPLAFGQHLEIVSGDHFLGDLPTIYSVFLPR